MLSNTCKYGIRAMVYLAVWHNPTQRVGINQIAADLDLPKPFLGKILQLLAKNKLLISNKGPNGGFALAKPAKKISLYDIIKIIDGDDIFTECMIGLKVCENNKKMEAICPFCSKSHPVRSNLKDLFKNQSLDDFSTGLRHVNEVLHF